VVVTAIVTTPNTSSSFSDCVADVIVNTDACHICLCTGTAVDCTNRYHPFLPTNIPVATTHLLLEGMALSAGQALGEAPDEIRELIEDLVAISQVADDDEPDDESEQQLMEIVEYVRLGALAVFTEFNPPEQPSPNTPTLH
jgi:hypothetical protein